MLQNLSSAAVVIGALRAHIWRVFLFGAIGGINTTYE